ncbi:restriction endonuclease subunit S [Enterococcus faecalis]|uniref:restriction endonuclease subunit S n=1 Tax=Enterococcus faecalis TaxID=1351 RepID=UPI000CF321D7|nr:restriction endonuclease subunit S [Enterococcus faecalis]EGO6566830.1 restriction endonuclease subunit S [Enterococcus faecalis]EGO8269841.1 restriction endonuclease subunit S [Enterococcus faecalis]EGO8918069.1 restriction endonuclease subunit S [Enterococcus faecalis]EGO9163722.1 restriction endonuclease subunit S [Enterococcus faecalis]EGO9504471.1 restriction endonuclease subunit S [Enterococcus faecalis]
MSNNAQPEIWFPGFTEGWEQHKLIEVARYRNGKAHEQAIDESGKYIVVNSKFVSTNGRVKKYTNIIIDPLKKNELAFVLSDVPNGKAIARTFLVDKEHRYSLNQRIAGITPHKDTDSYFLNVLMNRNPYFLKFDNGVGQTNLTKADVENFIGHYPSYEEQQKIGMFFKQLDDTIALHQRKLDLLKETKKGFLQKMFPKNGAKVPEIRFPGFTDDWEQRKLASMTNYKNGKGHEDKQSTIGKLELINLNSISISGGLKHSGKFIDEADDTLQKDDLVMILSDVGHGDLLGRVALIPEDDRFVLNQRVALLRPNATADPQFLFSYINAHQYYFKAQGAGMSQLNISKGSVENFISFVPIIEEQKKIGTFFKQLDDTIALHQRKLDLLKETKKGFLQKMFV